MEFKRLEDADHARCAMNEQKILDKIVVVRFATNKSNQKRDLSNDFHIFVGDLSQDVQVRISTSLQNTGPWLADNQSRDRINELWLVVYI